MIIYLDVLVRVGLSVDLVSIFHLLR